jgi:hypothetical protein
MGAHATSASSSDVFTNSELMQLMHALPSRFSKSLSAVIHAEKAPQSKKVPVASKHDAHDASVRTSSVAAVVHAPCIGGAGVDGGGDDDAVGAG